MRTTRILTAALDGLTRRPWLTLVLVAALALAGGALALGLRTNADTSSFVSGSSPQYRATQRYYRSFGEEPIDVVVQGSLQQLLLSSDIDRLVGLEGCLSGKVPAGALGAEGGARGPCGRLARAGTVQAVLGPGTFVNEAAEQIDEQLASQTRQAQAQAREAQRTITRRALAAGRTAAEARTLGRQASSITMARFQEGIATLALQYGLTSQPSLDDPGFVSTLVFDSGKPAGTPKQRFAYLFPSPEAAVIAVRLKAGLPAARRARTIALIDRAVGMRQWRLQHGERYLVTGEPAIVADLASSIGHSIALLVIAVLAVMAIALGLVFRERPRLLPLATAGLATLLTFGALALFSGSLSVAQVAVLPILVGLAVDYAIQYQSRVGEVLAGGIGAAGEVRAAVREGARLSVPTIATALAATAAATVVLLLSPVPMVRGFAVLLVAGIAFAFACALSVGSAALVIAAGGGRAPSRRVRFPRAGFSRAGVPHRREPRGPRGSSAVEAWPASRAALAAAWRGARELLADNPLTRLVARLALVVAVRAPGRVLLVALLLAALGWGLDTQTRVQTNIEKLVPQNTAALRNLHTLERLSGVGGVIYLTVEGADVAKPATIEWMSSYESAMLARFGYAVGRGCGRAQLCPAFSLPDLFHREGAKSKLTSAEVNGLLDAIPPYFSQAVIAPGRRLASLAFGIRLMSLDEQQRLVAAMRTGLRPPAGVHAQLVGLSVLAAQANAQIASPWRRLEMLLAGLAAVALVLLIVFRGDLPRALAPLIPVVLASGWSALVIFAVRVPLNPMSLALGVLVIAIATEFSVLLSERHRQERLAGHDGAEALRRAYRHTGAAVAASGVSAIAGFGVLVLSDIAMLRDFGAVTVIDLAVSLIGVLVVLPAAVVFVGATQRPQRRAKPRVRASDARGAASAGRAVSGVIATLTRR